VSAGQRLREPRAEASDLPARIATRNPAVEIFIWSRLAIWLAALFALFAFDRSRNPDAARWDDPSVTHDLGAVTDVWARWDSIWFLRIAEHGYEHLSNSATAFFPLYPAAVGLLGRVLLGHYVLAGIVVSLTTGLATFVLLYRLAEDKIGADGARRAVLYLALFPMALFLQAVYSESLYLMLTVVAFLAAERRRFLGAGLACGLALLTRPVAVALLPALAIFALRSAQPRRNLAQLAVAPLVFATYPLLLWAQRGNPWTFLHAEGYWSRKVSPAGPIGGAWDGLRAGWAGARQLASGSHVHSYWPEVQGTDPMRVAAVNLECLAALGLFTLLAIVAWRRFGAPYGLFSALSLAIPLSMPSDRWPLLSLPRLGLGIFPLFLALAVIGGRPRIHTAIVSISALFLGVAIVQWALWQWVA
jgi:Gpi18-like mannosyltransferase